MRSVPPRGALGVVTGAIATGAAATSTSTTTIITIRTTISIEITLIEAKPARATGGNTIRNIVEMRHTAIEGPPTNLAVEVRVAPAELVDPVVLAELAVRVALVEPAALAVLAGLAARAALVEPVVQVGLAVRAVLAEPAVPVELAERVALAELVVPAGLAEPVDLAGLAVPAVLVELVVRVGLAVPAVLVGLVVPAVALERGPVAALLKTKSAIEPRPRDQVAALRAADLAEAAAQTTRGPAVAEAVVAWAAAE